MTRYIVMRRACLMEDEGRTFLIASYDDRKAATAWIDAQITPGDYYIAEVKDAP